MVLTASAGAGHLVAAEAMRAALQARRPDATVEVHDVLNWTNRFFRALYSQGYLGLVRHAPAAMGWLYDATDRARTKRDWRAQFQNLNAGPIQRALIRAAPDLIVNTHFLSAEVVAGLRRRGRLQCPQVTVTTDFETHRLWVQEPTERYYTATEEGKAYLVSWGVTSDNVRISGIPVRPAFANPPSAAAARESCGLKADRPVVLLLCGGFGVGPTEELLQQLRALEQRLQVVVITGRNELLRRRLERITRGGDCEMRVLGFIERMHEWMAAADLVVTKPGGLTAAEALACGTPLVIVNPIPGQETRNSDFLLERGAAIKVNNPRLLGFRVLRLLSDGERLAQLRGAARRLAAPNAAELIAEDALRLLSKS